MRILVLGAGHSEMPLLRSLKRDFNFQTICVGRNKHAISKRFIDEYYPIDYSNSELCLKAFRDLQCHSVIAGCNDFAEITAQFISQNEEGLEARNYKSYLNIHHKDKFEDYLNKRNLSRRKSLAFSRENYREAIKYMQDDTHDGKYIIKPIDLSGGKGMSIISNPDQLHDAIEFATKHTRNKIILIERYFLGTNHACSMLFDTNGIIFTFFDQEQHDISDFSVSSATSLSNLDNDIKKQAIELFANIWEDLKAGAGLFHIQFILNNCEIIILEITKRCPGDIYPELVKYSTGFDYIQNYISLNLFQTAFSRLDKASANNVKDRYCHRQCVYANKLQKNPIYRQIRFKNYLHKSYEINSKSLHLGTNFLHSIDFYITENERDMKRIISFSSSLANTTLQIKKNGNMS